MPYRAESRIQTDRLVCTKCKKKLRKGSMGFFYLRNNNEMWNKGRRRLKKMKAVYGICCDSHDDSNDSMGAAIDLGQS